jgi:hypothetical protein
LRILERPVLRRRLLDSLGDLQLLLPKFPESGDPVGDLLCVVRGIEPSDLALGALVLDVRQSALALEVAHDPVRHGQVALGQRPQERAGSEAFEDEEGVLLAVQLHQESQVVLVVVGDPASEDRHGFLGAAELALLGLEIVDRAPELDLGLDQAAGFPEKQPEVVARLRRLRATGAVPAAEDERASNALFSFSVEAALSKNTSQVVEDGRGGRTGRGRSFVVVERLPEKLLRVGQLFSLVGDVGTHEREQCRMG